MSRLDREAIFNDFFGIGSKIGKCPVCQNTIIHINSTQYSPHSWQRGHIIPASLGGPDIYPNLLPICNNCNISMQNINLFQYMYENKLISQQEANYCKNILQQQINNWNPVCTATNKTTRKKCTNLRWGKSFDICKKHIQQFKLRDDPMDICDLETTKKIYEI